MDDSNNKINGGADIVRNDDIELKQTSTSPHSGNFPERETSMQNSVKSDHRNNQGGKCANDDVLKQNAKRLNSIDAMNRDTFDTPVLESRPPSYMWLAICTTIFFNPLTGIIAMVIAFQADHEYIHGNSEKARKLGIAVKIISILSICLTLLLVAILAIFLNVDFSS